MGRDRLRRGALLEKPHQHAESAGATPRGSGEIARPSRSRDLPAHRDAADQPPSRPVRAAAAGGPPARPQLSIVCKALLRGRTERVWVADSRRVERRRADGAAPRCHAAQIEGQCPGAAAEAADVADRGGAEGHRRARHEESRGADDRATRESPRGRASTSSAFGGDCSRPSRRHARRSRPRRCLRRSTSSAERPNREKKSSSSRASRSRCRGSRGILAMPRCS